jgi:arylsulfatase A-like enzyme
MQTSKLTRREFGRQLAVGVTGVALGVRAVSVAAAASGPRSPNIVLILTDQQFGGALSCAGNSYVKTPVMDSLAARGVRFDRAYCGFPLCVPSRSAMVSGRRAHETSVTSNLKEDAGVWDFQKWPTVANALTRAGYDCDYTGKWHLPFPRNDIAQHGFGTQGMAFLHSKRDRPFYFVASYLNPHDICEWARNDVKKGTPNPPPPGECPPLPANFTIPTEEPPEVREYLRAYGKALGTDLHTPDRWRQYLWVYYRLVESVDQEIGKFLSGLSESGNDENTIIIFTSDHGDGMGSHQINQKWALYEEEIRVPLIITGGSGSRVDATHLVSTGADLVPTICDFAGATPPPGLTGRSLRPLVEQQIPADWRDAVVVETRLAVTQVEGRALRTDRHKYIVYEKGEPREQLFDLQDDPGETRSLLADAQYRSVLEDHRARLRQWAEATGDMAARKFLV